MPLHDWSTAPASIIFYDFHAEMMVLIKHHLNAVLLPETHYAMLGAVAGERQAPIMLNRLFEDSAETLKQEFFRLPRRRMRVVVRQVENDKAVAHIDMLTPGNKATRRLLGSCLDEIVANVRDGVHTLLIDLLPPGPADPQGILAPLSSRFHPNPHPSIAEKPLMVVSYRADNSVEVRFQSLVPGESLPDMPLFLGAETFVWVALEQVYQEAHGWMPRPWRALLDRPGP